MNAVEIEEAISALASTPFDAAEFPYAFLQASGNKETTLIRTARHRHGHAMKGSSTSLERTVEKSVDEYRPVLHVLAAAVVTGPLLSEVDEDRIAFMRFLSIARGFEVTLDQYAASHTWQWAPMRIDPAVPAMLPINLAKREKAQPMR